LGLKFVRARADERGMKIWAGYCRWSETTIGKATLIAVLSMFAVVAASALLGL
jgi:hypothetical protein